MLWLALLGYLALLLTLTFWPLPGSATTARELNMVAFKTINHALRAGVHSHTFALLVGNIAAFVPLGLLVPLLVSRWRLLWVLASGLVLSIGIELTQLAISRSVGYAYRSADIDDVILNVGGVLLGYAVYLVAWLIRRGRRAAVD